MSIGSAREEPSDVICVSTADWDAELWTNKQHLMHRLSQAGARVLYMDSLGLRAPGASGGDAHRIWRRLKAWRPYARAVSEALLRDSPLVVPFHGNAVARGLNRVLLSRRLARNFRRWQLRRPVLWTYLPGAVHLFDPGRHRALVYHCVDNLAAIPGVDPDSFGEDEDLCVRQADACIASSLPLKRRLEARGAGEVTYWPNPADTAAFSATRRSAGANDRPLVGFVGAVQSHKLDLELVTACARLRPDWDFWLIGPVGLGLRSDSTDPARFPTNVHCTGPEPKEALPEIVSRFDVGIIPYRINPYTNYVFPMKLFEYLAAGVPVVSTPLPSLVGAVRLVTFASTPDEFVRAIEREFECDRADPSLAAERAEYAAHFSWENRVTEALELLRALPSAPGLRAEERP
jgi:glycosyltransferase involved in cell wall biosynthesis